MSITVKVFDEARAKAELKNCPKIVRDYVKLLQQHMENWKDISGKAISKLQNTSVTDAEIKTLKQMRSYFGEHDAEISHQYYYHVLDQLIKRISKNEPTI